MNAGSVFMARGKCQVGSVGLKAETIIDNVLSSLII